MILDTSALVAILQAESGMRGCLRAMEQAAVLRISAANWVETSIVIWARYGAEGWQDLDRLLRRAAVEIVPVDAEQAQAARHAFRRFGKGHHRAALNFGDCFAYALALTRGEPLLCQGDDFRHTGVPLAVNPGL